MFRADKIELFTVNFNQNGGKFLYSESLEEAKEFLRKILEENRENFTGWGKCDVFIQKFNHDNKKDRSVCPVGELQS